MKGAVIFGAIAWSWVHIILIFSSVALCLLFYFCCLGKSMHLNCPLMLSIWPLSITFAEVFNFFC